MGPGQKFSKPNPFSSPWQVAPGGTPVLPPAITVAVSGLDATVTNTGGAADTVNWGDGTTNALLTHTYAAAGVYEIVATNSGGSSTAYAIIEAYFDVYSLASAITPVADGTPVNTWANAGTLGGSLATVLYYATPVNGPRYRPNSGVPYLEMGKSGTIPGYGYGMGIDVPGPNLGDFTLFLLCKYDISAASQGKGYPFCTRGSEQQDNGGASYSFVNHFYNDTNSSDDGPITTANPLPSTDGKFHVRAWRRVSRVWTMFVDGQIVQTRTGTSDPVAGRLNVGMGGFDSTLVGGIGGCLYKSSALSDATIADVSNWMLGMGLTPAPTKGMVVCGDSTSTPANAFETWADQTWLMPRGTVWQYGSYLQTNNALDNFWNMSWGGKNTSQNRTAESLATISGLLQRCTSKKVLLINTGTNDIRAGGAGLTPAQSYAQISGLITDVRALVTGRVEVVVCTICDGNPAVYTGFTALRNTLNGLIVAGAAAGDYTLARVDLDPIGYDWGTVGRLDTYFYGDPVDPNRDGLHRIAPGMDREAIVIRAAIASVL